MTDFLDELRTCIKGIEDDSSFLDTYGLVENTLTS